MPIPTLIDLEQNPLGLTYSASGYDLDGYRRALASIGTPQSEQNFIHIAGTKGKGSIAVMIERLLLDQGFHTSTFTSPHLRHYGERFRFDGIPWTPTQFDDASQLLIDTYGPRAYRTAFEFLTSLALIEFSRRSRQLAEATQHRGAQPHIVCWETGLGGRLDCTNVVQPLTTVISRIGLDHTQILGTTIREITLEKCGIIKHGVPVVLARQDPRYASEVCSIVAAEAAAHSSPLIRAWEAAPVTRRSAVSLGQEIDITLPSGERVFSVLPMHGEFQCANLEAAVTAICQACHRLRRNIESDRIASAISRIAWPGRLEVVHRTESQALAVDGAHCPLSARAVGESIYRDRLMSFPLQLIWSMQRDKAHMDFLLELRALWPSDSIECIRTFPTGGERGADPLLLAEVASSCGIQATTHPSASEALQAAMRSGSSILATGSLTTVAQVRDAQLGICSAT